MIHDPHKHHEFVLLFELKNADLATPDGTQATASVRYGLITEDALKGLIGRQVYKVHGLPTLIRWPGRARKHLLAPLSRGAKGGLLLEELRRYFYDLRLFGLAAPTPLLGAQGTPGEAGPRVQIPAALRLSPARTVDPLLPLDGQPGSYGLYRLHGSYNPEQGQANGVTASDLEVLWQTLAHLFEPSPEMPPLQMGVCGLWVFSHDGLGGASVETLLGQVAPTRRVEAPRSLQDYHLCSPQPGPLAADPRVVLTCWA